MVQAAVIVGNHECICEKPLQRYSSSDIEYHKYNCPQRRAAGLMCHRHFEDRNRMQWEVDECADCIEANRQNAERIQQTRTIDPNQPHGQHISLTCKNHPTKRWHTKNIDFIGARTIFFSGDTAHDHEANPTYVPHSFLKKGTYGPVWMTTPCSMRQGIFGEVIYDTELDCECPLDEQKLIPLREYEESKAN